MITSAIVRTIIATINYLLLFQHHNNNAIGGEDNSSNDHIGWVVTEMPIVMTNKPKTRI